MNEIVRYKLSGDKKGLLGVFKTGEFYHIHADEMSDLERWIHKLLNKIVKKGFSTLADHILCIVRGSEVMPMAKCIITNNKFCWILAVDGVEICFSTRAAAEYFAAHYNKLGYEIEKVEW